MVGKERFKLIPAVHLLLVKGNNILLLRRYNTGYEDGNYSVPAGHLDGDETVTNGMIREAVEEVGLKITPKDLKMVHVMHRNAASDTGTQNERVDFFLLARTWNGNPEIIETDKCDELRWVPLTRLPENVIPYVRHGIDCFKKGISFSEFGW